MMEMRVSVSQITSNQQGSRRGIAQQLMVVMRDMFKGDKTIVLTPSKCLMSQINGQRKTRVECTSPIIFQPIQLSRIKSKILEDSEAFTKSSRDLSTRTNKFLRIRMVLLENSSTCKIFWLIFIFCVPTSVATSMREKLVFSVMLWNSRLKILKSKLKVQQSRISAVVNLQMKITPRICSK